jgi:hypothetical protein
MKQHLKHLAMCAPMIVLGLILLIGGAGAATALLPVVACIVMMWLMMRMMGHSHDGDHGRTG